MVLLGMWALPLNAAQAEENPCTGSNISLGNGTFTQPTEIGSPTNNATYVGHQYKSTAPQQGGANHAVKLGGTTVVNMLCLTGPIVDGNMGYNTSWTAQHAVGGYGFQLFSKDIEAMDLLIDNVQDGIKLQNCAEDAPGGTEDCKEQKAGGRARLVGVLEQGIQDDAIDNDDCMAVDVEDSLFDGVHTGYSEQMEDSATGYCISYLEDTTNRFTDVIIRLDINHTFNPCPGSGCDDFHGAGKWFKCDNGPLSPPRRLHSLVLDNVTLAVQEKPRLGWDSLDMCGQVGGPNEAPNTTTTWLAGTSSAILYLGDDTYGGPHPNDINGDPIPVYTGATARSMYETRRDAWRTKWGYSNINGLDTHSFPVARHGAK
jgi:hypothetical protein